MKALVNILVLLFTLSPLALLAQDAPSATPTPNPGRPSPEETFKRFDVNGDGKITKEEAPPRLVQSFDRFDITKDGFITLREFKAVQSGATAGQAANPEATFKRFDVNGDGKISKEEAPPRLQQSFDRFDITKDGFITLREFNAARNSAPSPARRGSEK